MSALSQFASAVGKSGDCDCEQDFAEGFDTHLAAFTEALSAKAMSAAGIANNVSIMRSIKLTYNVMLTGADIKASFADSLNALIQAHDANPWKFCAQAGIDPNKIYSWINGSIPTRKSVNDIKKIEHFYGLPSGSLINKIPFRITQPAPPEIESRKRTAILMKDRYAYNFPSNAVRAEWEELLRFHTAPYLLNGLQRNSTWRVKPIEKVASHRTHIKWEGTTANGVCITASINWWFTSRFFGFLLREEKNGGKGMHESHISLALLSDAALTLEYIEFRRNRTGVYTKETGRTIAFATGLLRPNTGFLWQHAKFAVRLPVPLAETEWHAWCGKNRTTLTSVYNDLSKGHYFQKGRDPKEPIAKIIAEQHPIHVLVEMVQRMEREYGNSQFFSKMRPFRKRNILLVKMLLSNPLRANHYSIMTYRKDNTGNLYQNSHGAWRLRFQPIDFKNQLGAASKDYDVILPPWLYPTITEYLKVFRPQLLHSDTSDYVFLNSHLGGERDLPYMTPNAISNRMRELTRKYIPDCPGFGPHAFRHIVATDYIKNNPNGFQVAANILHDTLTTVMKEYAHVKVADGFAHWTAYLELQICAAGGAKHE
jgi:integrase